MRVESIPEPLPIAPPPLELPPPAPIDRQRRGAFYVRMLAAAGIALTLYFLWQYLLKP